MEELKALIKEQNELLKEQNQLLITGFSNLIEFGLINLEQMLSNDDPQEPEVVAYRLKNLLTEKRLEALKSFQDSLETAKRSKLSS